MDTDEFLISPNFGYKKLENPNLVDLIDVFEDRMRNWCLLPARELLGIPNGMIAATALLTGYFEGIEIYLTGKDSKKQSRVFFVNGFLKVFMGFSINGTDAPNVELVRKMAIAIYDQVRCGFAHDWMIRYRVSINAAQSRPLLVTYRENGIFESVVINPHRFYESIMTHFESYLKRLREGVEQELIKAFEAAVQLKWGINEPDVNIGMNEEDYQNFCKPAAGADANTLTKGGNEMGKILVSAEELKVKGGFIDVLIYTLSQFDTKKELDIIPDPNNDLFNTFTSYDAIKELEDLKLINTGGKVLSWEDSKCYTGFFPVQATLASPKGVQVLEALKNERVIAKLLSQSMEQEIYTVANIVEKVLLLKQEIQDCILTVS